jgi:hypothetical protein
MSTPTSTAQQGQEVELWTLRGLIAQHQKAALAAGGLLAAMVLSLVLAIVLGSNAGAVTDATTCTQWGSTTQNRQTAYAGLYLREHGAIPRWGGTPADVLNAINWGCGVAYGDDVSDNTTVVQAITGNY